MPTRFSAISLMAIMFVSIGVFATPVVNTIYVGVEDIRLLGGDRDYQDSVVKLSGPGLAVVSIGTGGGWQPMVAPSESGTPFWANVSWDGPNKNIGYYMIGTGGFAGSPSSPGIPVANLQYWGNGTNADNSFLFFDMGPTTAEVTLEVSAWSGVNQLYWFNALTPWQSTLLFSGSANPGDSIIFNACGIFGLKIVSPDTNSTTLLGGNQFALFRQNESPVPEPATYAMMGLGLAGLGLISRRRKPGQTETE